MSKLTLGNLVEDWKQVGRRDAFHAPAVLVQLDFHSGEYDLPKAGEHVRFTDDECTKARCCDEEQSHGIIDPFAKITWSDESKLVWVLIKPGIVNNLVHSFDLNVPPRSAKEIALEEELERCRNEDPNCAECYYIDGDRIGRM